MDVRVPLIDGQRDDLRVWKLGRDRLNGLGPPHHGHTQVHQGDVGPVRAEQLDGPCSIARLGHELEIGMEGQHSRQTGPVHRVIVNRQDPDRRDRSSVQVGDATSCCHSEWCPRPPAGCNTSFG